MVVIEEIARRVQKLPGPMRSEVLHYVDYLLARAEREENREQDQSWSDLSLQSAMRGLEDEGGPDYSETDLHERFS
ncbi:MAG: hypothetical protein AAGJ10_08300 [Bacteroidota bacterium]